MEEAAKAAEQVAEVADQTTEIVEQTTVTSEETIAISDEITDIIEQVSSAPSKTTTLVTSTTTSSVKVAAKHVALLEKMAFKNRTLPTPMFDNHLKDTQPERFSVPVFKVSKNRLLDNMTSNRRVTVASVTGRKLIKQSFSARTPVLTTRAPALTTRAPVVTKYALLLTNRAPVLTTRAPVLTKKAPLLTNRASGLTKKNAQVAEANDCRSLLLGASCQCRVQGTCRCDCGRQTTSPQPVQSAIRFWPTRIPIRSLRLTHQFEHL